MPEAFSTVGLAAIYVVARMGSAISPAARDVRRNACAVVASAERSRALFGDKADAISQILAIVLEHAEENWDNEGASAVDEVAAHNAVEFLRALPADVALPEFSPEPDGAISLDWMESRNRLFSVSIGTTNRLPYAWLDGADRGHAVAVFDGEQIPERMLAEILKLHLNGPPSVRSS